jgi:hypothetical protein
MNTVLNSYKHFPSNDISGVLSQDALILSKTIEDLNDYLRESITQRNPKDMLFEKIYNVYISALYKNWDGYGGRAITQDTYKEALKLASFLPSFIQNPDIDAESDGCLAFEWYKDRNNNFSLTVYGQQKIIFNGFLGADVLSGNCLLLNYLPEEIENYLIRLVEDK